MPKATEPRQGIVAALDAFVGAVGAATFQVNRGDLFDADHPLVAKHPHLFGSVHVRFPVARAIEQATAGPGEKRGA